MSNNKNTTDSGKAKSGVLESLSIVIIPSFLFLISTGLIAHFHQFQYIHQLLPEFLEKYVEKEYIPLALIGLQGFFTTGITGIFVVLGRAASTNDGYDNNYPRKNDGKLTGLAARLHAAHLNAHEAFPSFASAVLCAYLTKVPEDKLIYLATVHTLSRFFHFTFYVANLSTPRSIIYNVANYANVYLFLFAVVKNFDVHFQTLCKMLLATPF